MEPHPSATAWGLAGPAPSQQFSAMADPLILTLDLGPHQARYDALRCAHFPPRPYRLPAHLTLFHKLPGEEEEAVGAHLALVAKGCAPLPLDFAALMPLGGGVAVAVRSPAVLALRAGLAAHWHDWLSPQDRGFRAHVTIQNKVDAETARATLAALADGFEPHQGVSSALCLWRYRGGPWEAAGRHRFRKTP